MLTHARTHKFTHTHVKLELALIRICLQHKQMVFRKNHLTYIVNLRFSLENGKKSEVNWVITFYHPHGIVSNELNWISVYNL